MKTGKEQLIELMDRLPDDISAETILTELQFALLILRRGEEAERGENVVSSDEAKRRLAKWLS
jgi:hypothetical protein